MPLTDTKLQALYGKPYFGKTELSDRDGLSARVTERGTISWQYRYRWQGKAARLKIGRYPDLKLADARALIPAIRGALERNEHPRVFWDKLHQKHDVTLKQCCEHFREHHLPKLRPRTVMLYEHTMQRYFEPLFIGIPVEQAENIFILFKRLKLYCFDYSVKLINIVLTRVLYKFLSQSTSS